MKLQYAVMSTIIPHSIRKTQPCGLCEPTETAEIVAVLLTDAGGGGGPVTLYILASIPRLLSSSTNGPSA